MGMGIRHVGEKVGVRSFKKERGVICHSILGARVIKNRRVEKELLQMDCTEAEKVCHHQIYCGGFLFAPGDSWSVVRP